MRPILTLKKGTTSNSRIKMTGPAVGKPVTKPAPKKALAPKPAAPAPTPRQHSVAPDDLKRARQWVRSTVPDYPFAIGVREQLLARKPDDVPEKAVGIVLFEITRSSKYLESFEIATHRHSLDGATTPLEDAHRIFANGRLFERQHASKDQRS